MSKRFLLAIFLVATHLGLAQQSLSGLPAPNVSSGTSGHFAYYPSSGVIIVSNTNLDDGATNANGLTYAGSAGVFSKTFTSTDTVNNTYVKFGTGSSGDSTCPTPVSGTSFLCTKSSGISSSINGGAYAALGAGSTATIASGTATLGTSSIASGACATVVTVAGAGIAATDSIVWSPNASIKAVTGYAPSTGGGLSISTYPTSGNANFDVCNWASTSITPGAVTLNWRVMR